jgi:3-hydroxybutyryl-CoA dehydrogenase
MDLSNIKQVGIVGGGLMGYGIAVNFALGGYRTVINDLNEDILAQTMQHIEAALRLFVDEDLIAYQQAEDALKRITTTPRLKEITDQSDFITEAVIDRLKDKQALFNYLDATCPPHTILATNTSSLVLRDIGSGLKRQDKLVLTHYFAPPHIVPGVEVAKGPGTSNETYEIVYGLMKKVKKVPIRVLKEKQGYLLNRIQGAMVKEAMRLWAEGVASAEDIELGIKATFGFRMPHEGPMGHYDLAGIWRWPADVRSERPFEANDELSEKVQQRMAEGRPWFVTEGSFNEATEKRDREYIRRLKALYPWDPI